MAVKLKGKTYKKKAAKRSAKTPIMKMVKNVLFRNAETKYATNQYTLSGFNSQITGAGDFIACLPNISPGTGQNQRVGSSIKPVKMTIRGYLIYRVDANIAARMIGTRLFCFSDKTVSSYTVGTSAGPNFNILDSGGSPTSYTGTALQYMLPHNSDAYKWYADRKHVIQKPYGLTNTLTPSISSDITAMHSSMYKSFVIDIPIGKMPATLRYDESVSSSTPVNFAPYLAVGYSDLLTFPADTTVTQLAMEFVTTLHYKDV